MDDRDRKKEIRSGSAEADESLDFVNGLCHIAVVHVSELAEKERMEPVSVYGQILLREQEEGTGTCKAAGHVKDELFTEIERDGTEVDFKIFGVPGLSEPADGI